MLDRGSRCLEELAQALVQGHLLCGVQVQAVLAEVLGPAATPPPARVMVCDGRLDALLQEHAMEKARNAHRTMLPVVTLAQHQDRFRPSRLALDQPPLELLHFRLQPGVCRPSGHEERVRADVRLALLPMREVGAVEFQDVASHDGNGLKRCINRNAAPHDAHGLQLDDRPVVVRITR